VSGEAFALALAAAVVHACWQVGLGGMRDSRAGFAVALPFAVLAAAPLALVTWDVQAEALPWVAASGALELAYVVLLTRAYDRADVSVVYPISRGSSPVLVLAADVVFGYRPGALQTVGVVLVGAGVLAVRGARRPAHRADVLLALSVGVMIAGYTLIDREGIQHADVAGYFMLSLLPGAVFIPLWVTARDGVAPLRAALGVRTVLAGVGMFAAYGLVLAALRLSPAPPVAAVRESSIVVAALLAALVLREPVTGPRLAGSAAVAAGVALIALS
jgi:drug/metabolite transporter (DMT)-like permease